MSLAADHQERWAGGGHRNRIDIASGQVGKVLVEIRSVIA
jgi:hypothetical protein